MSHIANDLPGFSATVAGRVADCPPPQLSKPSCAKRRGGPANRQCRPAQADPESRPPQRLSPSLPDSGREPEFLCRAQLGVRQEYWQPRAVLLPGRLLLAPTGLSGLGWSGRIGRL